MVGIASKFRMGLHVARHHTCEGTESGGGFSSGYVLISFQTLTSSRRQLSDWLNWTKETPTPCIQTGENPSYKGGRLEIGSARSEEWTRIPKPWTFRWPHPPLFNLEWRKEAAPNVNLWPQWYWTPGLAIGKGRTWEKQLPSRVIMLNPRG